MTEPLLSLDALAVRRGTLQVLDGIGLTLTAGEFVGLIGPNGSGKTTLLRAALGLVPASGQSNLTVMSPAQRARHAAYLPQGREIAWPVPVEVLVALGRLPHRSDKPNDRAAVERALAAMGLGALRHRRATELSGGEQARALIARALAQEAPLLLADEPTAGLDPAAQIGAMQVFAGNATAGGGVLAALHDLAMAARYCTRLVLLEHGRIAADGPPSEVLSSDALGRAFGIRARFEITADGPLFQPLGILPSQSEEGRTWTAS